MTTSADARALMRTLGLSKAHFNISVAVGSTDKTPPSVVQKTATTIVVWVVDFAWGVEVYQRGSMAAWKRDENRPIRAQVADPGWRALKLRVRPPALATLPEWIEAVGEKLGVTFRPDRARVRSDVDGAAKRVRAWLGSAT